MKTLLIAAALGAALPGSVLAQTCSKQSPAHTVALLELYTSEGCSSCPPADKFISGLNKSMTSDQVVPLALHVDYWDYIGWKDPFARRAFTERQRWLADQVGSRTVYTPEFFVAGRELRGWARDTASAVQRINARPAQANITITSKGIAGGKLPLEVRAHSRRGGHLFVALVENGLTTVVKAGENDGSMLRHDHVVRDWIGPVMLTPDGDRNSATLSRALTLPTGAIAARLGIAAFVQNERGEVLQAVAMPACTG